MAHIDPKAKKECRYRVNLNHYQSAAVDALAALHRKQAASYLAEIIEAHLESFDVEDMHKKHNNSLSNCA